MERRTLGRTGMELSVLGYGASPLGNEFGAIDVAEGHRSVRRAIDLGINLFDTSPYYGRTLSESVLGDALVGVRDRVFLSSKVGRYDKSDFDFRPATIIPRLEETLRRLKTDHLDLVIAHDIEFQPLGADPRRDDPGPRPGQGPGEGPRDRRQRSTAGGAPPRGRGSGARLRPLVLPLHAERHDARSRPRPARGLARDRPAQRRAAIDGVAHRRRPAGLAPRTDRAEGGARRAVAICRSRGVDLARLGLAFSVGAPFVASTIVGMPTVSQVEANVRAVADPVDPGLVAEVRAAFADVRDLSWPSGLAENQ